MHFEVGRVVVVGTEKSFHRTETKTSEERRNENDVVKLFRTALEEAS